VRNRYHTIGIYLSSYLNTSPYLLPNAEPTPYSAGEHIITASSKMIAIDKLLADILPKGERVLIFSVSSPVLFSIFVLMIGVAMEWVRPIQYLGFRNPN
jgi:hypothetical protein